ACPVGAANLRHLRVGLSAILLPGQKRRVRGAAPIPFMFARVRTTALCVGPIRAVQLMSIHDVPLRRARPFYPWVSEATPCVRYGLHAQASSGEGAVLKAGRIEPE